MTVVTENEITFSEEELTELTDSEIEGGALIATLIADLNQSREAGVVDCYIHNSFGRDGGYFMPKEQLNRRLSSPVLGE